MPDRDIPKKVDEYVQQIKKDNPGKGGEVGSSGPLMLRRDYGSTKQASARTASTGQSCKFFKANDGNWYMGLSDYPPEDDEDRRYWEPEYTYYGPFNDVGSAERFLHRNFPNPGGSVEDPSGRRPPPYKPISPKGAKWRYAATKRVVARYLGSKGRG